jgi:hypothetical protein
MACWLFQLWNGGLLSKVKLLSFLRKLPTNSYVNSSDFVSNLSVMCSFPCACWITLMFLINLQEETWKGCGRRAAYRQLFCSKSFYSTGCVIERIQVITKTSFIHFSHVLISVWIGIIALDSGESSLILEVTLQSTYVRRFRFVTFFAYFRLVFFACKSTCKQVGQFVLTNAWRSRETLRKTGMWWFRGWVRTTRVSTLSSRYNNRKGKLFGIHFDIGFCRPIPSNVTCRRKGQFAFQSKVMEIIT